MVKFNILDIFKYLFITLFIKNHAAANKQTKNSQMIDIIIRLLNQLMLLLVTITVQNITKVAKI